MFNIYLRLEPTIDPDIQERRHSKPTDEVLQITFDFNLDLVGYFDTECVDEVARWPWNRKGNVLAQDTVVVNNVRRNIVFLGIQYNDGSGIEVVLAGTRFSNGEDYVNVWNCEGYSDQPSYYDGIAKFDNPSYFPKRFREAVNGFFRHKNMYINKKKKGAM